VIKVSKPEPLGSRPTILLIFQKRRRFQTAGRGIRPKKRRKKRGTWAKQGVRVELKPSSVLLRKTTKKRRVEHSPEKKEESDQSENRRKRRERNLFLRRRIPDAESENGKKKKVCPVKGRREGTLARKPFTKKGRNHRGESPAAIRWGGKGEGDGEQIQGGGCGAPPKKTSFTCERRDLSGGRETKSQDYMKTRGSVSSR